MPEKEKMRYAKTGPFTFDVGGTSHKVKIGATVPPMAVLYMDKAVEAGFFSNRSDFVTQAMLLFIERKKEEINFDEMLKAEINAFFESISKE